jgi:hypothetical protein
VAVTTQWRRENEKIMALKGYMMDDSGPADENDLLEVSDRAIKTVVLKTLEDQGNIEVLQEPKQSKFECLTPLTTGFFGQILRWLKLK